MPLSQVFFSLKKKEQNITAFQQPNGTECTTKMGGVDMKKEGGRDERGDESRDFRDIPRVKKSSTAAWFGLTAPGASTEEASFKKLSALDP